MSRQLLYVYQGIEKTKPFSFREHRTPYEAAAQAENIDISGFLKMEQQLEQVADGKTLKSHRESYFKKLGFEKITLIREE